MYSRDADARDQWTRVQLGRLVQVSSVQFVWCEQALTVDL